MISRSDGNYVTGPTAPPTYPNVSFEQQASEWTHTESAVLPATATPWISAATPTTFPLAISSNPAQVLAIP